MCGPYFSSLTPVSVVCSLYLGSGGSSEERRCAVPLAGHQCYTHTGWGLEDWGGRPGGKAHEHRSFSLEDFTADMEDVST